MSTRVSYNTVFKSKGIVYESPPVEQLEEYFAHKMQEASSVRIVNYERSFPGFSRETSFVTVEITRDGRTYTEKFVFCAKPTSGGLHWMPLSHEAEVLKRLQGTSLPVPRLLWHETDTKWIGREFFVREWIEGVMMPEHVLDQDPKYDEVRERVVKELMDKLAMMHNLDWKALGLGEIMDVPSNPEHAAIEYIDWAIDHLKRIRTEPLPEVMEALMWLRKNPPPKPSRICLRKENHGIGEEVWRGYKIVGLMDWETASLGDPALDIFWAMMTTGNLWDRDKALKYYEEVSGNRIDPENLAYYTNIRTMRGYTALNGGLFSFSTGADKRVQLASLAGYNSTRRKDMAKFAGF
ncbi:MAG: phosphotransferase family protein [Pseudomonadota bacterium]